MHENHFGFSDAGFTMIVPSMPPVCVVIGTPNSREEAVCMNAVIPSFVIYGNPKKVMTAVPGDTILVSDYIDELPEELCRESKKRHEQWNPYALIDVITSFRTLGYKMEILSQLRVERQ